LGQATIKLPGSLSVMVHGTPASTLLQKSTQDAMRVSDGVKDTSLKAKAKDSTIWAKATAKDFTYKATGNKIKISPAEHSPATTILYTFTQ